MHVISPSESTTCGYDSAHKMTNCVSSREGESTQSSLFFRKCEWCAKTFSVGDWPRWKQGSGRFCDTKCARAFASSAGWRTRSHRITCWSASPLSKAERNAARAETRRLIRGGEIVVPARCQSCRKRKRLETHHVDYADPRNVLFLCKWCHQRANVAQRKAAQHPLKAAAAHPQQAQGDQQATDSPLGVGEASSVSAVRFGTK